MKAKRNVIGTALFGVVIAFLFLAPVISYSIPFPSPIGCTMNGCDFLRYGSVSYWAFGVGATVRDLGGYSLSLATATEATRGTSSVSYTVSGLSSAVSPSATSNSSSSGLGLVTSAQIVSVSLVEHLDWVSCRVQHNFQEHRRLSDLLCEVRWTRLSGLCKRRP